MQAGANGSSGGRGGCSALCATHMLPKRSVHTPLTAEKLPSSLPGEPKLARKPPV